MTWGNSIRRVGFIDHSALVFRRVHPFRARTLLGKQKAGKLKPRSRKRSLARGTVLSFRLKEKFHCVLLRVYSKIFF